MTKAIRALRIIVGAMLFAIVIFIIAAASGLLSDTGSTVPVHDAVEAGK
jgi:hypothetical protein